MLAAMNSGTPDHVGPSEASSTRQTVEKVSYNETSVLISAKDTVSEVQCSFVLRGAWCSTQLVKGDLFRVILTDSRGVFIRWDVEQQYTDVIVIDDERNFAHHAPRRPFIRLFDRRVCFVCAENCASRTQPRKRRRGLCSGVFGNTLHDLFQTLLVMLSESNGNIDPMELAMLPNDLLRSKIATLYQLDISTKDAFTVLHDAIPKVIGWYEKFFQRSRPTPPSRPSSRLSADNIAVSHVQDIEELVWSPCTGLKGKIDATVGIQRPDAEPSIGVMELKTGSSKGNAGLSHFAQ
eukprot:IDg4945t1